jgi:hypothetical protein
MKTRAEHKAEPADTQEVVSDATAQAMVQAALALAGALFASPGGATTALRVARIMGRNFPLVLLLVMIGALVWPTEATAVRGARGQAGWISGRDLPLINAILTSLSWTSLLSSRGNSTLCTATPIGYICRCLIVSAFLTSRHCIIDSTLPTYPTSSTASRTHHSFPFPITIGHLCLGETGSVPSTMACLRMP